MSKFKDYYAILEISPKSDLKEIKKAYRDFAFLYHPDRTTSLSDSARKKAESKMKEVNEAYSVLSDSTKKKIYDDQYVKRNVSNQESQHNGNTMSNPNPRVDTPIISINDFDFGQTSTISFIVYNDGGLCNEFYLDPPNPPVSWLKIISAQSLGSDTFPLQVDIEITGQDWGTTNSAMLKIRMDNEETYVSIVLQMKDKPQKTTYSSTTQQSPSFQTTPVNQGRSLYRDLKTVAIFILVIWLIIIIFNSPKEPKIKYSTTTSNNYPEVVYKEKDVVYTNTQKVRVDTEVIASTIVEDSGERISPKNEIITANEEKFKDSTSSKKITITKNISRVRNKSILKLISANENLMIEPLDGKAIISKANKVFLIKGGDKNFVKFGLNNPGSETGKINVSVYETIGNGEFIRIFNSINTNLDNLVMSQEQIIRFCEKYPSWLATQSFTTLFLIKKETEYFVVGVSNLNTKNWYVSVLPFNDMRDWKGYNFRHRIVIPKL